MPDLTSGADQRARECAEDGCYVQIDSTADNRCGVQSGNGCGELFCADHLFVTYADGNLCARDYNAIDDREPEDEAGHA